MAEKNKSLESLPIRSTIDYVQTSIRDLGWIRDSNISKNNTFSIPQSTVIQSTPSAIPQLNQSLIPESSQQIELLSQKSDKQLNESSSKKSEKKSHKKSFQETSKQIDKEPIKKKTKKLTQSKVLKNSGKLAADLFERLENASKRDLKEICSKYKIPNKGLKKDLIERLRIYLKSLQSFKQTESLWYFD